METSNGTTPCAKLCQNEGRLDVFFYWNLQHQTTMVQVLSRCCSMVCWSQESLFINIYKWDIGYTLKIIWWGKKNPKFMPCSITSDAIPQVLPLFWHQDNFREEEVKLTTSCFLYVPQLDKSRDLRQCEKVHTSTKEINFHSPDCLWLYSSEWYEKSLGEVIARPLQLKTHR